MKASVHVPDPELEAVDDHDAWARLHSELGALPRSFREPLVLCYFDGLTQEQAAAQLHCPLGTIQSRLARGRAKLKARLEKRGVGLDAVFAGDSPIAFPACPAPPAWSEATVRLAMQFAQGQSPAIGARRGFGRFGGGTAARVGHGQVESCRRDDSGLGSSASRARLPGQFMTRTRTPAVKAMTGVLPAPEPVAEKPQPLPESVTRTIRGVVRDELGRPMAKAWIGDVVVRRADSWEVVELRGRARETKQPFRDETGKIVAAGGLGRYFEVRDEAGNWRPIHPSNIRRWDPARARVFPSSPPPPSNADIDAAREHDKHVFEVRLDAGRWRMSALSQSGSGTAHRTDPDGRFFFEFTMSPRYGADRPLRVTRLFPTGDQRRALR